jgi:hypothetical protein
MEQQKTLKEAVVIEKIAMDKLKNKWGHLYIFGYPQRPFPTNYENDLNNIKIGLYEGTKWQQEQDKNKFSEEEVYSILEQAMKDDSIEELTYHYNGDFINLKEWFEQFKKK